MRKLSTGADSTLGNWYDLCAAFFGKDSAATKFIQDKIYESKKGRDEEVIAEERQLLFVLGNMFVGEIENDKK